jgi:hypothetical protein
MSFDGRGCPPGRVRGFLKITLTDFHYDYEMPGPEWVQPLHGFRRFLCPIEVMAEV